MINQIKSIGDLYNKDKNFSADKGRVILTDGICVSILSSHYKDPPKILEKKSQVLEIGNLKSGQQSWKSPQTGRVYHPKGIAPTLNTCGGAVMRLKFWKKNEF